MGGVKSRLTCFSLNNFNCWSRRSEHGLPEAICTDDDTTGGQIKMYSWDVRPKLQNQRIERELDMVIVREPGSINGEQIIIENCRNCKIYILDHSAAINIDDCEDCIIITGPVKGSIFLRDTSNSTLCSVSGQLRLRDCKQIHIFGGSESEPIIEASMDVYIGPYTLNYNGIDSHFKLALLYPDKLVTETMYDFTPPNGDGSLNWKPISGLNAPKYLPTIGSLAGFSTDESNSFVRQYTQRLQFSS